MSTSIISQRTLFACRLASMRVVARIKPVCASVVHYRLPFATLRESKIEKDLNLTFIFLLPSPCPPPSLCTLAAIKDMAQNVERRWRQLLPGQDSTSKTPEANTTEGGSRQFIL